MAIAVNPEFLGARRRLVQVLKANGIFDPTVLKAVEQTPRHLFVPTGVRHRAYEDTALQIGQGQTISQPTIHARYLELLKLKERKVAVLLNSHLLSEVERVCDTVLFMRAGKLLRQQAVQGEARLAEVRLANPAQVAARLLQVLPDGRLEGSLLRVPLAGDDVMPGRVRMVVEAGGEVLDARMAGAHLEQLYLEIVEGRA